MARLGAQSTVILPAQVDPEQAPSGSKSPKFCTIRLSLTGKHHRVDPGVPSAVKTENVGGESHTVEEDPPATREVVIEERWLCHCCDEDFRDKNGLKIHLEEQHRLEQTSQIVSGRDFFRTDETPVTTNLVSFKSSEPEVQDQQLHDDEDGLFQLEGQTDVSGLAENFALIEDTTVEGVEFAKAELSPLSSRARAESAREKRRARESTAKRKQRRRTNSTGRTQPKDIHPGGENDFTSLSLTESDNLQRVAAVPVFLCDVCAETFSSQKKLQMHRKTAHSGELENFVQANWKTCSICNKNFHAKTALRNHLVESHGIKGTIATFDCDICGKQFTSRSRLKDHQTNHSTVRPHMCATCGKTYKTERHLKFHMHVHADSDGFPCAKCGKVFKTKHYLNMHMQRTHPDTRRFNCDFCGKMYKTKNVLDEHIEYHKNEKNYICDLCGGRFNTRKLLGSHKKFCSKPPGQNHQLETM